MKHVFALAAYGDSPYLGDALDSLINQDEKSDVIVSTSTPSEFIKKEAGARGIELFIRDGEPGLSADWNFALQQAVSRKGADIVTIAHQDDIYHPDYAGELYRAYEEYPDMSLFTCDFNVIDASGMKKKVSYERVKRILRAPLRLRSLADRRFIKRMPLIYGNAICAPTCAYNIRYTGTDVFRSNESFVADWRALLRLSGEPGRFISAEKPLIDYRVHSMAQTVRATESGQRVREEYEVFSDCHSRAVALLLMHFYKRAQSAYE